MKETKMCIYNRAFENGDKFYDFELYTELSSADKLKFVDSVVDVLVDENHYNSIIRDLIFDYFTIKVFTNIDTDELDESLSFLDDVEQFLEETNIIDVVRANVLPSVFVELNNAVDKSIQYLTGIHTNPLNEAFASLIDTIEKKINEVDLDSMMSMAQKFAGMTEGFTLENAINAYMNSDVHKKNLDEIEKAKDVK